MNPTLAAPHAPWKPVTPRTTLLILLATDLAFFGAHVVGSYLKWVPQPSELRLHLADLSDLGDEASVPTWFAIAQLFASAALFAAIGIRTRIAGGRGAPWFVFSALLVYLSVDEQAQIHERLVEPMRQLFGITTGPWLLAWVIPALVAVALVGLLSIRFVIAQPMRTRVGLLLAASVYVLGAVGMEMLDASTYEILATYGEVGVRMKRIMYGVEELLELVGVSILVATLVARLSGPYRRGERSLAEATPRPLEKV